MTCDRCFKNVNEGAHGLNVCPYEPRSAQTVIGDDIPGGVAIKNGLCWPDGTPRVFYTKSEIAAEAKRRGLTNFVRHVDGSKVTSRWV